MIKILNVCSQQKIYVMVVKSLKTIIIDNLTTKLQ